MQGQPLTSFKTASKEAGMDIRDFKAPEGESWKDVNERARDFIINDIIANFFQMQDRDGLPPGTYDCLVVTHGGFIMEFTNAIRWLADPTFEDKFNNNSKNTSISIYKLEQQITSPPARLTFEIPLLNFNDHVNMTLDALDKKYGNPEKKAKTVVFKNQKQKEAFVKLAALAKAGKLKKK